MNVRRQLKEVIGQIRPPRGISRLLFNPKRILPYGMPTLEEKGSAFLRIVETANQIAGQGKKIFLFGAQYYWTEYCTVLGLALAAMGHCITVGYLPFSKVLENSTQLDIRRYDLYTSDVLGRLQPRLDSVSLIDPISAAGGGSGHTIASVSNSLETE
jgi:hypothetical protein